MCQVSRRAQGKEGTNTATGARSLKFICILIQKAAYFCYDGSDGQFLDKTQRFEQLS